MDVAIGRDCFVRAVAGFPAFESVYILADQVTFDPVPAPQKEHDHITAAGDMVVYCAGFPAIYGRQPLYFEDRTFAARAAIPPPGIRYGVFTWFSGKWQSRDRDLG